MEMTEPVDADDNAAHNEQTLGFWNPAFRPDTDETNPSELLEDSTTENVDREISNDDASVASAYISATVKSFRAEQANDFETKGVAAETSVVHEKSYEAENIGSTDEPAFQIRSTSAIEQSFPAPDSDDSLPRPLLSSEPSDSGISGSERTEEVEVPAKSPKENAQTEKQPWPIHRKQTNLGNLLGDVQRTSTFPGPLESVDTSCGLEGAEALPASQAQNVLRENGNGVESDLSPESEPLQGDISALTFSNHADERMDGDDVFFHESPKQNESSLVSKPSPEEARFEEGLPLVGSPDKPNHLQQASTAHKTSLDALFGNHGPDDNENFFSQTGSALSSNGDQKEHQLLVRKTTSEVVARLGSDPSTLKDHLNDSSAVSVNEESEKQTFQSRESTVTQSHSENIAADQWKAMLEDDDEFLVEDADDLLSDSEAESHSSFVDQLQRGEDDPRAHESLSAPPTSSQSVSQQSIGTPSNPYAPHQPSTSDLAHGLPGSNWGNVGLSQGRPTAMTFESSRFGQQKRPQASERAESFVDQSRGGYKSPYDLPMDLTKPRKRVQAAKPTMAQAPSKPPPPPRSSSIMSNTSTSSISNPPQVLPPNTQSPPTYRPQSSGTNPIPASTTTTQHQKQKSIPSTPSFFEELPISTRPRPPTAQGRYTPQIAQPQPAGPPSSSLPKPPALPHTQSVVQNSASPTSDDAFAQFQLQKPARFDPFSNVPLQAPPVPVPATSRYSTSPPTSQVASRPPAPSRYSPVPPALSNNGPPRNRYVSQPGSSPMPPSLPFQPRTSSPLAHHEHTRPQAQVVPDGAGPKSAPSREPFNSTEIQSTVVPQQVSEAGYVANSQSYNPNLSSTNAGVFKQPPQPLYHNQHQAADPSIVPPSFMAPKRSQTSSPGKRDLRSSQHISPESQGLQRPVSAHGQTSPVKSSNQFPDLASRPAVRQRGLTQNLAFIPPQDNLQLDELQRWRGSPIFRFGFGGSTITSFPRHIPRYVTGQAAPMIKPSGGNVKVESSKGLLHFVESLSKFPGPLRSKSKKKELLTWLSDRITVFQHEITPPSGLQQLPDPRKRHEEKIILWRLVRAVVESDGFIEGKPEALKAVGAIISPELEAQENMSDAMYGPGSNLSGIYQPVTSGHQSQPLNTSAMETIRKNLLRGDREKAVWDAVDAGLWAHAMLIASTLDKRVWGQVVQEFVRQEVKPAGMNTESLAALYEIFAGNLDESVDELVPPSARAGLQMVSKISSAGPTKNALEGLDRWRETLTLVLNNRSPNDHEALATLGRLLASYGRVEAAHCCFLFSRALNLPNVFGASDETQSSVILLGADHRHGADISLDEDAILLTEAYEFATSVLPGNTAASAAMPHLQAFKLQHAFMLAENGFQSEAQQYCDAIAGSLKASTKASPYHHVQFLARLDDLTKRLQQAPIEGSSSWISKPSMEKVSGSMWNKFSNFIAGDESDAASTGSGKDANNEFGPFAKMSGTPTISRAPSVSDLYGTQSAAPSSIPASGPASRYAPSGQYTPNNPYGPKPPSESQGGRTSLDSQLSPTYVPGQVQRSPSFDTGSFAQQAYQQPYTSSPYQPSVQSPPQAPYQATPPQSTYTPTQKPDNQQQPSFSSTSYIPTPPSDQALNQSQSSSPADSYPFQLIPPTRNDSTKEDRIPHYEGGSGSSSSNALTQEPGSQSFFPKEEQQSYSSYGNYDPYAPSTYTPYVPESDPSSSLPASPRKSEVAVPSQPADPSSNPSASTRAQRDREADEAFRRAAEVDAARDKKPGPGDKTLKPKSSWFGSWFKGNSDDLSKAADSGSGPSAKVIRAKLGEESSFYYDPDLKKWVNRKDPGSATTNARATPPPPRAAPPSRSVSGVDPPVPPTSRLASSTSMPALNAPPAGPPLSRSETPASRSDSLAEVAGSNNDNSGGLAPRPALPVSRPSSTMSNASNIDDLLGGGPPQVRKAGAGGTMRGKKKGRGYVDVMAK